MKHSPALALFALIVTATAPALAHTSSDWNRVQAEIRALPADGSLPPSVIQAVLAQSTPSATGPQSWQTISTAASEPWPAAGLSSGWGGRQASGALVLTGSLVEWNFTAAGTYDPTGLVPLFYYTALNGTYSASRVSITGRLSTSELPQGVRVEAHYVPAANSSQGQSALNGEGSFPVYDAVCQINSPSGQVSSHCVWTSHWVFAHSTDSRDNSLESPSSDTFDVSFVLDSRFGIYINQRDDEFADWKIGDQPWHSQAVSAQLTPAQREQARTLFARGFELYKGGDLVGARAMVAAGLKADPGNYLGWFTLGEIGRSALIADPQSVDGRAAVNADYQHTIDLAPDSPEAILAKSYLR